jgi:hypothetical protein
MSPKEARHDMKTLFQQLRHTLPRHRSEFARAKDDHPAFESFGGPGDVLTALGRASALSHGERNEIVRSLVLETQWSSHPLWAALLILAFEPALWGLRRRVGGAVAGEDVDQELVESLLEAASTMNVGLAPVVLTLQRSTARKFFQRLRARWPKGVDVPLDDETPEVPWHREQPAFVQCAAREVLRVCERVPGATAAALNRAGIAPSAETPDSSRPAAPSAAEARRLRDRLRHRDARVLARVRKALGVEGR